MSTLVGAAVLSGSLVGPASAAPSAVDCPEPFPTEQAVDGVLGSGLTVERGTTADEFDATVLGRIDDGISSGVDLIIAELSSPAIDRAGGIWAGMSGSPVYAEDGRLIGAVSYSLAAGSPIAGITPAESMLPLVGESEDPRNGASVTRAVKPSSALARGIAETGAVTTAEARDGFRLLGVPVRGSVSNGVAARAAVERMQQSLPGVQVGIGGARAQGSAADPADIVPGSNFAAALSYGDVTFAGVGTTTFVCDGVAVAFGHPFLDTGGANLSAHTATAVVVQKDPVFGSFKVANPGGVVGSVTRDARVGIAGPLGVTPASFPVTASITGPDGTVRTGSTRVVEQDVVADVAALQAISTVEKAYGAASAGTVDLTLTVKVRREDGRTSWVKRSDVVSSRSSLTNGPVSYAVADEVYRTLSELTTQDFEDVVVESVAVTGTASRTYSAYTLRSVERRQVGPFAPMKEYTLLQAGIPLELRLGVRNVGWTHDALTTVSLPVPANASGGFGVVDVMGGAEAGYLLETDVDSFDDVLRASRTRPGNASVTVVLTYDTIDGDQGTVVRTKQLQAPLPNAYRSYEVEFR